MISTLLHPNPNAGILQKAVYYSSVMASAVFSPVVLPVFTFSAIVLRDTTLPTDRKWLIWGICLLTTTIIISAYVMYLKASGAVGSLDLDLRQERTKPFIVGLTSNCVGFTLVYWLDAPPLATWLMFCFITNTLLVQIITRWWKVSIHATSVGGAVVSWAFLFGTTALPWFVLVPIVGFSRVVLRKHTIAQVIVGSIIGLCLTAVQLRYLLR
jgi:membrane-associated phospholipid phosphatase